VAALFFEGVAMTEKSPDLHGNAPDNSTAALLLIDVINNLEFEGGEILARHALTAARHISALNNGHGAPAFRQFM
jgi:hypothetical protein